MTSAGGRAAEVLAGGVSYWVLHGLVRSICVEHVQLEAGLDVEIYEGLLQCSLAWTS